MSDEPDFMDFRPIAEWSLSLYRAVIRDGGTHAEAHAILTAFFAGMIHKPSEEKPS